MMDTAHVDRKPVVLVADDDEVARLLIESVLADADFRVVHAHDGREAIDVFPRERPDIVLLDVNMPDMDGYETCRALRALPCGKSVPILMVTAHDGTSSIDLAYEAGATDFLTKSSNWALVMHRVRYMLRSTGIWADAEASPQRSEPAKDAARPCEWQWRAGKDSFALSQELRDLLGLAASDAEVSRVRYLDAIPAEDRRRVRAAFVAALRNARDMEVVHGLKLPDGSSRKVRVYAELQFDSAGRVARISGTLENAAASPEEMRFGRDDRFDGLTGLPNRPMFRERLSRATAACARAGQRLALMFLDLDQFKSINDEHGHAVGDQVLAAAAKRLGASLAGKEEAQGGGDDSGENTGLRRQLGRMGGDRFCLYLSNIRDAGDAAEAARRVLAHLAQPMRVGAHEITLDASMGVAMYPDDGADSEVLLHHAEAAAYHAREEGSNNFHFFASAMNAQALHRPTLEQELREALDKCRFTLYYQPLVSMTDGRVIGAEALIRWWHPQLGLLLPAQFMRLAEDSGLIVPMGEWVLQRACSEAAGWRNIAQFAPNVSVNLSSAQLRHPALVLSLQRALDMGTLQARLLTLEISEATLCADPDAALAVVQQLAATGVRLCMDNFSASREALTQLRHLPLHAVKIDRSIVLELPGNPDAAAQARAFAGMTDNLMLSASAEGVETQAQLRFLREIGCKTYQGYLFSRPLPAEAFAQLLRREPEAQGGTRH